MGKWLQVGRLLRAGSLVLAAACALLAWAPPADAAKLPTGFQEKAVFSGLTNPTAVAFAPDGRVFVAEKSGVIRVFDGLDDPLPSVFADLSPEVYNFWDRGLLGLALDPDFPARPYLYVAYALDALPGGSVPKWGGTTLSDPCPTPPGPTTDGCVVTGRVSRLTVSGSTMSAEKPLITDWCQQFPSHSLDDVAFGSDGALYVSAGEGANFGSADWGQSGNPLNPCGDPPGGIGAALAPPTAEGGALRAQDVRTEADPTGLDGAVLRVDPDSGAGLPGNPLAASADANARRIVAYGLRNPFRVAPRPGSDQVWVGDVGWGTWEEIDRIDDPADSGADNFGWPCYEGGASGVSARTGAYEGAGLDLCKSLYSQGAAGVVAPFFSYNHADPVLPGESCTTGSSSVSGLAFYGGSAYPARYKGALFFADYSRNCIWAMLTGANGNPNIAKVEAFDEGAAAPVNLVEGPDGALYYPDFSGGKVWRIGYSAGNSPPSAVIAAVPANGPVPLTVHFSAAQSTDPDPGSTLSYAWDLDGDGQFDDSTALAPEFTYVTPGTRLVQLRVTDPEGASDVASVSIQAGNTPPSASIAAPAPGRTWSVGEQIDFAASATDAQDGNLPASAYDWTVIVHHCPSNCHDHTIETLEDRKSGSIVAPDHEYPSSLELRLTVTDSGGLTDTEAVTLDPRTVSLGLESSPPGLELKANESTLNGPGQAVTVIEGSNNSVIAPSPQVVNGVRYVFQAWSDGGGAAHNVKSSRSETLTATYARIPVPPTIAATYPGSPSNAGRPRVSGGLGAGAATAVELFANPGCAGDPDATGSPAQFTSGGIAVGVPANARTEISARAVNALGASACSAPIAYVEDSVAPQTTVRRLRVAGPRRKRAQRRRPLTFLLEAGEPVARFECALDAAPFARCASPLRLARPKPGRHRLQVRAVDLAGNADPSPAAKTIAVARPKRNGARRSASVAAAPLDRLGALLELLAGQLRQPRGPQPL